MIKDLEKHLAFIRDLGQKKGWQIDERLMLKAFKKPYLRFVYLKVRLRGKPAFFKYCFFDKFLENMAREKEFLLFLGKRLPGLTTTILDIGERWFLVEFLGGSRGCLSNKDIRLFTSVFREELVAALSNLQDIKKEEIPSSILDFSKKMALSSSPNHYVDFLQVKEKILRWLRALEGSPDLLEKFPEEKINQFLKILPEKKRSDEGVIIHGDFAPHNVFLDRQEQRVVVFDWELAAFNPNPVLGKAFDFAYFYLSFWNTPSLQEDLKKIYFKKSKVTPYEFSWGIIIQGIRRLYWLCRLRRGEFKELKKEAETLVKLIGENIVLL